MKIVIIIGSAGLGGLERVSLSLMKWLNAQRGCHATIVALSKTKNNRYNIEDDTFVELEGSNTVKMLRKYIKHEGPDIVLTMSVPLCLYTVPALLGLGVKHVISERNDPAHFAGKTITKLLARTLMRIADGYVFQTSQAQQFYGGSIAKKSVIIHNPLLKIPNEILETKYEERRKEIVTVGRLNKQKNQQLLIEAFASLNKDISDYTLIIYGEGPERDNLQKIIDEKELQQRVFLPGSTNDILCKIKDATMFVLSSDFEGMPNALMEAMSLGIPCISTDCPCGGPRELIRLEENGILVPVNDKDALVCAMKKLLENVELREKIGNNALMINNTHSSERICSQWLEYFNKIVVKY